MRFGVFVWSILFIITNNLALRIQNDILYKVIADNTCLNEKILKQSSRNLVAILNLKTLAKVCLIFLKNLID